MARNKHFSIIHYSAIMLILSSLAIYGVYYLHTEEFDSPLVEFEFAKDQSQINDIFTDHGYIKENVLLGIDSQNKIDFVFMLFYSSLLFFVFRKLYSEKKGLIFFIAMIFSLFVLSADIIENVFLLEITKNLKTDQNYLQALRLLTIVTRIKWYLLSAEFLFLSFFYFKESIFGKIAAVISVLPFLILIISIISQNIQHELIMSQIITINFIVLIIRIFIHKTKTEKVSFYLIKVKS